ncbi:NAD(P)-binding domain-containing protein [Actinoplanes regularis]|uniref:Predicted flavoprotein CzcO associated with the cation diffusion facilitator CzcD n=1 Tax=Actinoplanes regularis TaxID=52697 RepID=A0A239BX36_9ACTN|nr:NAD(P)-binding domain-containing protein [Actinoplanes regularis]GIE88232.1 FAD-dependent urate hydroxylase [Actinoplanes regularis]SNS12450.1 Predicted flavoprotein CzcO associated with the cation diffusion facilitator CzcD [Actinoplanes regularis]
MSRRGNPDLAASESLRLLGADPAGWVPPTAGVDHDVAIVGAGQSGLTIGYALRRAGITRVAVLDAAESESHVGGWAAKARMRTLRTAKTLVGPELGNPALSFRAWYEAREGTAAWTALDRIPTADWISYLTWFQRQVRVPVRRGVRVLRIEPDGQDRIRLHLRRAGTDTVETARKVVLANGVEGTGGPRIPVTTAKLSPAVFAHTGRQIDFAALRGRTVAVVGAAASAFDAAATALEAHAAEVHLFSRRGDLVVARPGGNPPSPAVQDVFHRLPDAERWRRRFAFAGSTPLDSVQRATAHPNFHIHLAAPWQEATEAGSKVRVRAADGTHRFDFVIAGTGYQHDPRTRPELAAVAGRIALWRDRYQPPAELRSEHLSSFPYVGPGYELTARRPEDAGWLSAIHVFNAGASQSFGLPIGDVPSLRSGVPRLVDAIVRDLVLADLPRTKPSPAAPASREEYAHAVWKPETVAA